MSFYQAKNISNHIKLLSQKSREYKKMSSDIKENRGVIDFSNRQDTLKSLHELRAELSSQIRIIQSVMKKGVRNLAPTFSGASVSDHGSWGNLKGKYKALKSELSAIAKHVDFMIEIFESKKAPTANAIGELIAEVRDVSQDLKDIDNGNPYSDGLDVLGIALMTLLILRRNK